MGIPAEKLASYDDIFALPENLVGEIILGIYLRTRGLRPNMP